MDFIKSLAKTVLTFGVVYTLALFYGVTSLLGIAFKWFLKGKDYWTVKERSLPPLCLQDTQYGRHSYIRLKDIKLHYVENGDRSKPLVLFLHGFPEFWFSWRYQLKEFSKTHWTVALDMRGYGDSDKPTWVSDYSLDKLRKDVHDFIKALGREKCILVGHDWGGIVAWSVAMHCPEVVEKLVIINSPHPTAFEHMIKGNLRQFLKSWYIFLFQLPFLPELMVMAEDLNVLNVMFENKLSDEDLEGYKYIWSKKGSWTPPINYYRSAVRSNFMDIGEPSPRIKAPTLIIWGEKDIALDKKLPLLSAKYGDNIKVKLIPEGNHFVNSCYPKEVNEAMRPFIA